MKTSTLLKLAEDFLWDGTTPSLYKSDRLCPAIGIASENQGPQAEVACWRAQRAIMDALGESLYYTGWAVGHKHLPLDWGLDHKTWFPILQANRLNWLRELQRQFKLKGD